MATSLQYLSNKKMNKPVVVVAGKSPAVIATVLDEIKIRVGATVIERFSARKVTPFQILDRLLEGTTFGDRRAVIYSDVEALENRKLLADYVGNETQSTTLILVANTVRDKAKVRWIPSNRKVLYVDCNEPSVERLVDYAQAFGLTIDAAQLAVGHCYWEFEQLIPLLRLCQYLGTETDAESLKEILPPTDSALGIFESLSILDTGNSVSLARQFKRRYKQLAVLSVLLNQRIPLVDAANRSDMQIFLARKMIPLAKSKTEKFWLDRFSEAAVAEKYGSLGVPGVKEYLVGALAS